MAQDLTDFANDLARGVPAEIAEADPTQVGDSASVTAADLQAILSP